MKRKEARMKNKQLDAMLEALKIIIRQNPAEAEENINRIQEKLKSPPALVTPADKKTL